MDCPDDGRYFKQRSRILQPGQLVAKQSHPTHLLKTFVITTARITNRLVSSYDTTIYIRKATCHPLFIPIFPN